jgi:hypothetical protein
VVEPRSFETGPLPAKALPDVRMIARVNGALGLLVYLKRRVHIRNLLLLIFCTSDLKGAWEAALTGDIAPIF